MENDRQQVQEEVTGSAGSPEIIEEQYETEESVREFHHDRPRKVYKGMWGPLEIATVGISLFIFFAVLAAYLFFALPAARDLESNRTSRDALEKELNEAKRKFGDISTTEGQVSKLISSAEDFEARFLQEESLGKTAIYQRLNGLINAFGLVNSTGPDYSPIEISEEERREGVSERAQSGRGKFQSLFPGIYVTMTVEGSYANLRRFLNEIENSNEYIVISTVELEPSETEDTSSAAEGATTASVPAAQGDGGRIRGKTVSLRLELAAYFQRSNEMKVLTSSGQTGDTGVN